MLLFTWGYFVHVKNQYNTVCTELSFNHHLLQNGHIFYEICWLYLVRYDNGTLIPLVPRWEEKRTDGYVIVSIIWYAVWLLQNSECMIKGRNPHCFYSLCINWCTLCYTLTVYHWLYGIFYWCSVWYHRIPSFAEYRIYFGQIEHVSFSCYFESFYA